MVAKVEQYREKKGEGEVTKTAKVVPARPMEMPQEPSTIHVNMNKHDLGDVSVGHTMKMVVHAKVTAHNHDKYGHNVRMEISKIESAAQGGASRDRE